MDRVGLNRRFLVVSLAVLLVASLSATAFCVWQHLRERRWLAATARRVVEEAGARTERDRVIALRDYVRQRVRYQGAPHDDRPFLRTTARETLESGLGYCGESTRALIVLGREVGVKAQRINLHGRVNHVVADVHLADGKRFLVDPQLSPEVNAYFDARDVTAEELIAEPGSPFFETSNLNLRRVPILRSLVLRMHLGQGWLSDLMESPWLIRSVLIQVPVVVLISVSALSRTLAWLNPSRLLGRSAGPPAVRTGILRF